MRIVSRQALFVTDCAFHDTAHMKHRTWFTLLQKVVILSSLADVIMKSRRAFFVC
jgi:hypothetical protein